MANQGDKAHSKLGASGAERWTNCPGSVRLSAGIPEQESPAAYRGSAMHALVEKSLITDVAADFWRGKSIEHWPDYAFTEDDIDAVKVATAFARDHAREGSRGEWGLEQSFALFDFDGELFGTNDYWSFDYKRNTLTTADWKFGFGEVDAEDNMQLKFYALGAVLSLNRPVEQVETFIVQPADFGNPIKSAVYEPMDLLEFGGFLAERAAATRQPDAPLKSGAWCKFCKAKAICPRLLEDAQAVAGADFADTLIADDPPLLSSAELGDRLARADILEIWLKEMRSLARAEALAGRPPDGFKLVETRGPHRKFTDADLAMRQAARRFQLSETELFKQTPLSPAQFEKVAKKVADKKAIEEFVGAYLAPRKPGLALVSASDERPAVTPSADADFADLGDGDQ